MTTSQPEMKPAMQCTAQRPAALRAVLDRVMSSRGVNVSPDPAKGSRDTFVQRLRPLALLFLSVLLLSSASLPSSASAAEPEVRAYPRNEAWLKEDLARLAKDPQNADILRDVGIGYNVLGAPDNWEYILKAREHLEKAQKLRPNDPHTLIFLGSTLALQARHKETSLLEKKRLADQGLAFMDKAVALAPQDYRIRLLRATAGFGAPSFLGRSGLVEEDVAVVRKVLEPTPPANLQGHQKAAGYLLLGRYAESKGELPKARTYWSKAIQNGKGTRYETQAREMLKKIEGK
ncbi:MAG: hypothetical protein ACKO6N_29965 [Myxococcota bacterium]